MNIPTNPPEYIEPERYSIYVKTEGFIFREYFLFIENGEVNYIEYDVALLLYNFIKNKYGKLNFELVRTNQLFLGYQDIKNLFYKILSEYKYIKNNKNVLVLTDDPTIFI